MSSNKRKSPASPSGRLKRRNTSVEIVTDFPSTLLSSIPESFEKIDFTELVPFGNYSNKCILGKIVQVWPIQKRARKGCLRKFLLSDALRRADEQETRKLTVFLFDDFAVASDPVDVGGLLAVSNFHAENLTLADEHAGKDGLLPVQVLVMIPPGNKEDPPNIWLARQVPIPEAKSTPADKPRKRVPSLVDTEAETAVDEEDGSSADGIPVPETARRCYKYVKLEDLEVSNGKPIFNVYGIVEQCRIHLNQARQSYNLELRLSDQTKSDFPCTVIGGKSEVFIDVHVGDVIRIHRMVVENVRGKLRGKCLSPNFVVVFDKSSKEAAPKSLAKTFVLTEDDKVAVRKLFAWADVLKKKLICEIERDEYVDFLCQVIGVYIAKTTNAVVLTIWDGTKTKEFSCEHRCYPDEKIDIDLFGIARDYFVTLFVFGNYGLSAAQLETGMYIEVRDAQLHCPRSNPEHPQLSIHPQEKEGRGISVLDPSDPRLDGLKSRLEKITEDANRASPASFLNYNISTASPDKNGEDPKPGPSSSSNGRPHQDRPNQDSAVLPSNPDPDVCEPSGDTEEEIAIMEARAAAAVTEGETCRTDDGHSDVKRRDGASEPVSNKKLEQTAVQKKDANVQTSSSISSQNPADHQELQKIRDSRDANHASKKLATAQNTSAGTAKDSSYREVIPQTEMGANLNTKTSSAEREAVAVPQKTNTVTSTSAESSTRSIDTDMSVPSSDHSQSRTTPQLTVNGDIISIVNAGIEPGHSTQEFGGIYKEITRKTQTTPQNVHEERSAPGQVPSTQQTQQQPQSASDNLFVPTQFSAYGPRPKDNLYGSVMPDAAEEEWWKNVTAVSVTDGYSHVKPTLISDIINHPAPYRFRVIAAVLSLRPDTDSVRKLVRIFCPRCHYMTEDADPPLDPVEVRDGLPLYLCPNCYKSTDPNADPTEAPLLKYTFLVNFALHDGTAPVNIDAFLWKENAVKFFKGIAPEQALLDSNIADSILSMLWDVCPNSRPMGTESASLESKWTFYPNLDCCVISYNAGGTTRYQIFNTVLL